VIAYPAAFFLPINHLTKKTFQAIIIFIENPYLFSFYPDPHCPQTPLVFKKGMNIGIIPESKDFLKILS